MLDRCVIVPEIVPVPLVDPSEYAHVVFTPGLSP
jgi:hypothetical protein